MKNCFDIEIINGTTYLAGFTNSIDGDIPPDQQNYDVWLLALDANGNKIFSKIYGGSQNDVAYSMTKGADGYIDIGRLYYFNRRRCKRRERKPGLLDTQC